MTSEEKALEKLRDLPHKKQMKVLGFLDSLKEKNSTLRDIS